MKLIRTEEAKPGIKVARDVSDLRGNLLFKAGSELTAELIDRCRQRNISHLFVDDPSAAHAAPAADVVARREALAREIDQTFAGTESNRVMAALRDAAKRYLLSKVQ